MSLEKYVFVKNNIMNEIDPYYHKFSGIYLFAMYKKNKWVFTYGEFDNLESSILAVADENNIKIEFVDSTNFIPYIIPLIVLFSEESINHLLPSIENYLQDTNVKLPQNDVKPVSDVYNYFIKTGKNHSTIMLFESQIYNMNEKNILAKGSKHLSFWIDKPILKLTQNYDDLVPNDFGLSDDENQHYITILKNDKPNSTYNSLNSKSDETSSKYNSLNSKSDRPIYKHTSLISKYIRPVNKNASLISKKDDPISKREILTDELFEPTPRKIGLKTKREEDFYSYKRSCVLIY